MWLEACTDVVSYTHFSRENVPLRRFFLRSGDRLAAVDSGISSARSTGTVPWSDAGTGTVPWSDAGTTTVPWSDAGTVKVPRGTEKLSSADPEQCAASLIADNTDWSRSGPPAIGGENNAPSGSWRPEEAEQIDETWGRDAVIL
jgi:hypothetical protein